MIIMNQMHQYLQMLIMLVFAKMHINICVTLCCCAIRANTGCHQSGLENIQYTTLWSFPTKLFGSSYHMGTSVLI